MPDQFENDLKARLQMYSEEPDERLWKGISPKVSPVYDQPGWVVWTNRLSFIIVGISYVFLFNPLSEQTIDQITNQFNQHANAELRIPITDDKLTNEQANTIEVITKSENLNTIELNQSDKPDLPQILYSEPKKEESLKFLNDKNYQIELKDKEFKFATMLADTPKVIIPANVLTDDTVQSKRPGGKRVKRHRPFSMYVTVMPTFGYQRIESNEQDNIFIESIKRISTFSTDRLGLRAEAGFEFPLSPRWKTFGGLVYYHRKQTIEYTEKQIDTVLVSSGPGGEVIIEPQFKYIDKTTEYELRNLGIQLGVIYKLFNNKTRPLNSKQALSSSTMLPKKTFLHTVGMGIELQKSLNNTNDFDNAQEFSNPSMFVFMNLYYRMQYPDQGRLKAVLQPTFNYSFYINENLNAPFYMKPYGLGLNLGCTYNF